MSEPNDLCVTPWGRDQQRAAWRTLQSVVSYAAYRHIGQLDKGGEPYLWHVLRVGMSLLPDLDAARLGLLHDVLEDTEAARGEVLLVLEHNLELMADLEALTRRPGESYAEYIQRAADSPRAARVKVADLTDNLSSRRLELAAAVKGQAWVNSHTQRYWQALAVLCATKKTLDTPAQRS